MSRSIFDSSPTGFMAIDADRRGAWKREGETVSYSADAALNVRHSEEELEEYAESIGINLDELYQKASRHFTAPVLRSINQSDAEAIEEFAQKISEGELQFDD